MRGLRGDPLLKDSEALIDQYHSMEVILENHAQVRKALDDQAETFQTNVEQTRAWIRDLKQGLETLEADTPMQEKQMKAQVSPYDRSIISLFVVQDGLIVQPGHSSDSFCSVSGLNSMFSCVLRLF